MELKLELKSFSHAAVAASRALTMSFHRRLILCHFITIQFIFFFYFEDKHVEHVSIEKRNHNRQVDAIGGDDYR